MKVVFKAALFEVDEVELTLANGKKKTYHIVRKDPTVSVFPINETYEIYLVSQYRYLHKKITLEAMAGFINKGESPLSSAKRELQEETGIKADNWQKLGEIESAGSVVKGTMHLFLARQLQFGKQRLDEDEDITFMKISLEEAVKKVLQGEINHAASAIGILMLDRMRREGEI